MKVEAPVTPAEPQRSRIPVYENYEENLIGYDPCKELLRRGLSASEVATMFYEALYNNDLDIWLATLCEVNKTNPKQPKPGGFATVGWKEGRNKLRKYGTHYKPVEVPKTASPMLTADSGGGEAPKITLEYTPLYGAVPGYKQSEPIGDNVRITLLCEMDEWRVLEAEF